MAGPVGASVEALRLILTMSTHGLVRKRRRKRPLCMGGSGGNGNEVKLGNVGKE